MFLTADGNFSSSWPSGMFLALPRWPAANSAVSQTSMTTAFSRLIMFTACVGLRPDVAAPRKAGMNNIVPEASATRINHQFSTTKVTAFLEGHKHAPGVRQRAF